MKGIEIRSKEDLSGIGRILFHWAVGTFQLVPLGEFGQGIPKTEINDMLKTRCYEKLSRF